MSKLIDLVKPGRNSIDFTVGAHFLSTNLTMLNNTTVFAVFKPATLSGPDPYYVLGTGYSSMAKLFGLGVHYYADNKSRLFGKVGSSGAEDAVSGSYVLNDTVVMATFKTSYNNPNTSFVLSKDGSTVDTNSSFGSETITSNFLRIGALYYNTMTYDPIAFPPQ